MVLRMQKMTFLTANYIIHVPFFGHVYEMVAYVIQRGYQAWISISCKTPKINLIVPRAFLGVPFHSVTP